MKRSFQEKHLAIYEVLVEQMENQGVDTKKHTAQITKVADGLMLVEQCLWYRIDTKAKIEKMITSFEGDMERVLALLTKYEFENLVFTYRSNYTNLYTYKSSGEKRWYKLSKKDFQSFLDKVEGGKLDVVSKPKKTRKAKATKPKASKNEPSKMATIIVDNKAKVEPQAPSPKATKKDKPKRKWSWKKLDEKKIKIEDFIKRDDVQGVKLKLKMEKNDVVIGKVQGFGTFGKEDVVFLGKSRNQARALNIKDIESVQVLVENKQDEKLETKSQEKQVEKVETKSQDVKEKPKSKKKKKATRKGWVEKPLNEEIEGRTFIKVRMKDETNKFVRYMDVRQDNHDVYLLVNDHGKDSEIKASEIEKVYTYVK